MFTGIIDHCGIITHIEAIPSGRRLCVQSQFAEWVLGESIAIDGMCLTVIQFQDNTFWCDISPETERVTTAKNFKVGSVVNLERALQLSSRLGGHLVMGHVDQVCQVSQCHKTDAFVEMRFVGLDDMSSQFVIKKGSITINGVSLTINDVFRQNQTNGFCVMLIPHTLERTNLANLQEGDSVNIEFDMMARIIVQQLQQYKNVLM